MEGIRSFGSRITVPSFCHTVRRPASVVLVYVRSMTGGSAYGASTRTRRQTTTKIFQACPRLMSPSLVVVTEVALVNDFEAWSKSSSTCFAILQSAGRPGDCAQHCQRLARERERVLASSSVLLRRLASQCHLIPRKPTLHVFARAR